MTADETGIPAMIGPYRIAELLGEGGMGVVYRGISPAGEQVAVKQIRVFDFDAEDRARFALEMEALKTVFGSRTASLVNRNCKATNTTQAAARAGTSSVRAVTRRSMWARVVPRPMLARMIEPSSPSRR